MKSIEEIIEELSRPITKEEVEWKPMSGGLSGEKPWVMVLAYVDARAAMDRLDAACIWRDKYSLMIGPSPDNDKLKHEELCGMICELSILDGATNDWITRADGSSFSDVDPFKGSISGALKRAAVKFGLGRDLYDLPDTFANCTLQSMKGKPGWNRYYDKKSNKTIWWETPDLDRVRGNTEPEQPTEPKPTNTTDENPYLPGPEEPPKQEEPKKLFPKGDIAKASAAIRSAASKEEFAAYRSKLNEREWTPEEIVELKRLVLEMEQKFNL